MGHLIILFVFLSGLINVQTRNAMFKDNLSTEDIEERWIWGYVEPVESNRNANATDRADSTTAPTPSTTEFNPCNVPVPTLPDFSALGRRISLTKCYEYIWNIREAENKITRYNKCTEYKNQKRKEAGLEVEIYGAGIGGRDSLPGEFPHMAAIGWQAINGSWIFKCGGSLISDKFVLTAAHCSKASEKDTTIADVTPKIVRLADKNILDFNEEGYERFHTDKKILRFISHPNYVSPKKYFDIALIELTDKVWLGTLIQPACLYTGSDEKLIGRQANMTGWGVVDAVTRTTSPELQVVVLDVLSSEVCDNLLKSSCSRHWCEMRDNQMCAGKLAGGADACQGDSGGPLQIPIPLPPSDSRLIFRPQMHQVIGVTSFGVGCALPNLPGVYTKVTSFLDWIEDIVFK